MVFEKVVVYCRENNLSIAAFEKMCDIGNGVVARWKNNSSEPSLQTLRKIEEKTGIKVNEWIA